MKHLLVALMLVLTTVTSAFADRPSKEQLDAAKKAGRKDFIAKETILDKELKAPNTDAAKAAVMDVLALMRAGMRQTEQGIPYIQKEQQDAAFKHYNEMEAIVHKYFQLSNDVPANAKQLSEQAAAFSKTY